jgi:hypothetical protein
MFATLSMFRGCLIPIGAIVAIIFLSWYNWDYLNERRAPPAWSSVADCVSEHVRHADGKYPLRGDNPSDLRAFCQRAVDENLFCGFDCTLTSARWEFAISGPTSQRAGRLQSYFNKKR